MPLLRHAAFSGFTSLIASVASMASNHATPMTDEGLKTLLDHTPVVSVPLEIDSTTWKSDRDKPLTWIKATEVERFFGSNPPGTTIRLWGQFAIHGKVALIVIKSAVVDEASLDTYLLATFQDDGTPITRIPLVHFAATTDRWDSGLVKIHPDFSIAGCIMHYKVISPDQKRVEGSPDCYCASVGQDAKAKLVDCGKGG